MAFPQERPLLSWEWPSEHGERWSFARWLAETCDPTVQACPDPVCDPSDPDCPQAVFLQPPMR
ncbi:MAG: hypothetical protein OXQ90_05600, partial [Gammaproteobacteria bacterium]|nr:hypothetical protein [Gammaproteobacteria bacterium]